MYVVNLYATIDEQKQANLLDYMHKQALIYSKGLNVTTPKEAKINLERTIKELIWKRYNG